MRALRVACVLALLVAIGCEEASTGPTTTELKDKRADLKEKAAARKQQGRKPVVQAKAAKPPKAGAAMLSGGFALLETDYEYDPTGKRDPFRSFKWDRPDRIRDEDLTGPLEQFDLTQLSLVAVVWKTGNARALIQDPSGGSYIVAQGARMGKNEGIVTAIDDNLVRVKETYVDFLGRETTKDIELRMRGSEGG